MAENFPFFPKKLVETIIVLFSFLSFSFVTITFFFKNAQNDLGEFPVVLYGEKYNQNSQKYSHEFSL